MPVVELLVSVRQRHHHRRWIPVIAAHSTVGAIIASALYVQRFFEPVRNLVLSTPAPRAMAGGERIIEVLDTSRTLWTRRTQLSSLTSARVVFDHVSFDYIPGREFLDDINLHVKPAKRSPSSLHRRRQEQPHFARRPLLRRHRGA